MPSTASTAMVVPVSLACAKQAWPSSTVVAVHTTCCDLIAGQGPMIGTAIQPSPLSKSLLSATPSPIR